MAGTTRIGPEPHWGVLEHLKKLGLAHLLVSRQVPALTLGHRDAKILHSYVGRDGEGTGRDGAKRIQIRQIRLCVAAF